MSLVLKAVTPANSDQFEIRKVTRKLTSFFTFSGGEQRKNNLKPLSLKDNSNGKNIAKKEMQFSAGVAGNIMLLEKLTTYLDQCFLTPPEKKGM